MNKKIPSKFVGLHNHSQFSLGDAIGTPYDHLKWCHSNGLDAHAITDHGNINMLSHALLAEQKLSKDGKNIKLLIGVEAYFIPSLKEWTILKDKVQLEKQAEKALADNKKVTKTEEEQLSEEIVPVSSIKLEEDSAGVENEEESKTKTRDPLKARSHLVLLSKNSEGLKALFRLVSSSFIDGMYRYPRMDFEMLKKEAQGNIIASSACVGGFLSKIIFDFQTEPDWNLWNPTSMDKFEEIQEALRVMIEKFKWALGEENYFLEIQFNKLPAQHLTNFHLIEASKRTNTKLLVTCDAHYSNPEHWREREIYKMMAWMGKTKDALDVSKLPQSKEDLKCELYPKNAEQVWESYKKYCDGYSFYDDDLICEAIERSWHIAHEMIGEVKVDKSVKLPAFNKLVDRLEYDRLHQEFPDATEDELAYKELFRLAKMKLIEKGKQGDQKYVDRLKLELGDIRFLKFSKYFLTYYKIIELTQKELFIGNGRGSVSGSLLAYLLGLTQVDPIKFGTLWERFQNRYKVGAPDIDQDWSDRERAVELIAEHFGEENVISVTNFAQLQVASLIKDLAKFFGVPFEEVNEYTNKMRNEAMAEAKKEPGFDAAMWQFTVEAAEKDSPSFREFMEKMEKYPEFASSLKVLFKQLRSLSRHAGGVVITDDARGNMPIIKAGGKLQTPWPEGLNFRHLEEFGFLKFDILGLGTLRMFEDCIRKIIQKEQKIKHVPFSMVKKWFWENLHPDNNDFTDPEVYKQVYIGGKFSSIFQFVQKNVQVFMAEMRPNKIEDIAIATSIFRPGPLGILADKMYLENRQNPGMITYKHPLLEEVLKETSGLIIYQEQLQMIYHKLAGVPLDQTDNVRKAFTKKDISNKEKAIKDRLAMKEDFADKCLVVNQISKRVSYEIFDEMNEFVKYSFNKSHAIAYAITSWQCAYFLTYYPDEWITTSLDYSGKKGKVVGKENPQVIALNEARSIGYIIGKPDINLSENEFALKGKTLIPSFSSLKNIGVAVIREIKDYRPYNTLEDLLWTKNLLHTTWRHSKFNKRALLNLVKMEAFESMGLVGPGKTFQNYRQMYEVLEKSDQIKKALSRKKNRNHEELLNQFIEEAKDLPDWTPDEKLQFQAEISGAVDLGLICTPEVEQFLNKHDIDPIERWESEMSSYWAIVQGSSVALASTGKKYLKLSLMGSDGSSHKCNIWSFGNTREDNEKIQKNNIVAGTFKRNDYGMSTDLRKIYRVRG